MKPFLVRYGTPNKYDHAAYKTYCKVIMSMQHADTVQWYQQESKDPEHPVWQITEPPSFDFSREGDAQQKNSNE